MFASPFDLTQPEPAMLLVPLTDDVYDPDVLLTEVPDPLFDQELTKATDARNAILRRRRFLQRETNALRTAVARPLFDFDARLSSEEVDASKVAYTPPDDGSEAFGTVADGDGFIAAEVKKLLDTAAASPYTRTVSGKTIALFNNDDTTVLKTKGLQAFSDAINARINKVEDALNLNFLQTHTNIYRYRTNVLKASDASRLVTSPIVANIAERESAVATAQDLAAYISSISGQRIPTDAPPPSTAPAPPPAPAAPAVAAPLNLRILGGSTLLKSSVSRAAMTSSAANTFSLPISAATTAATSGGADTVSLRTVANLGGLTTETAVSTKAVETAAKFSANALSAVLTGSAVATDAALAQLPSKSSVANDGDVTGQLPLAGVAFNLRTLNIAERLRTSPSHEALLYSLSTRTSFLDSILADDFGISVDDLEILVHEQDPQDNTKFKLTSYSLGQLRTDAAKRASVYTSIQTAGLHTDADESTVFSGGITTLEHHTLVLRAVEARIALYRQFLALVDRADDSIAERLSAAEAAIKAADNALADARANLALVLGLLNDENVRVTAVNDRRHATLSNVPFVVLTRRGTVPLESNVPARQLFPANVASPVPLALRSTAIVPPELRELTAILREAPPAWFPAIEPLLAKLERPQHFIDLALQMRVRAFAKVQVPPAPSSATSHPGPFGLPIADMFTAQQSTMTSLIQQRASFDHTQLTNLSWTAQKNVIRNTVAINDLIASDAVHLEIASAVSSLIEQISKVGTALYIRVSAILPVERLEWAEYLRGAGRHVNLRSLTVLPNWNNVDYIERQQMQMIVDWLFTQIDASLSDAVAYMSDLVRTAILLASHAPVSDVIAGEVAVRTTPTVGGRIPITALSPRVAHGMPVLLYQGGLLAARAVVDDLDSQQVMVKVTTVYKQDAVLDQTAHAQFLNDDPQQALTVKSMLARR